MQDLTPVLLLLLLAPAAAGQEIAFDRVDGLSHNTVFALEQDDAGFIWIGTSDGLNRYDGYEFAVFRHAPGDLTSLSNNSVKCLLAGNAGTVLVGTDDGLNRYDPADAGFTRIALEPRESSESQWSGGPPTGRVAIHRIVPDSKGRVWVVADHGVFRMDSPNAHTARGIPALASEVGKLADFKPWSLFEDSHGVWVGSNQGWLLKHDETSDVLRIVVQRHGFHLSIHEHDERGKLWLTESGKPGLLEYDPTATSGIEEARITGADELSRRTIHAIRRTSAGFVWFGTDDGLYRLDPGSGVVYKAQPVRVAVDFLQNNIRSLFEDRVGALWVGTFSGLYVADPNRKPWQHRFHACRRRVFRTTAS